jgi:ABC-type sugar transport system ATPase subunit
MAMSTTLGTHDSDRAASPDVPLLSLRGITKNFGPVQALLGVDLDLPRGSVTALCGDNGAGKSVTIKIISGIWEPTAGDLLWNGQRVEFHNPRDADRLGISTVYQDLALCDNLDIVQNMFLGHETLRRHLLDEIAMETYARKTLSDLKVTTVKSVRQLVASLSGGQRQAVAVARAVMRDAELIIMDEPTAALGVTQTGQVLGLVRTLASRGIAVLMVSHNLNDVMAVADRVAVLYLGRMVSQGDVTEYDAQSIVSLMTTGERSGAVPSRVDLPEIEIDTRPE